MTQTLRYLLISNILTWATYGLFAQQGFVSFGGNAAGAGGSSSYSGGRIDFEFYSSGQGSLSLGLQHSWNFGAAIPLILEIPNTVVSGGQSNCYNAQQTVIVAGDGKQFTVQNGGHAEIIAGHNIFLLPGTRVFPGGSMHAYISTTWCDVQDNLLASFEPKKMDDIQTYTHEITDSFFKIYPTPTSGNFTLELIRYEAFSILKIEIYNTHGQLVMDSEMPAEKKYNLSITGKQPGIYLIRVINEGNQGIGKILKN